MLEVNIVEESLVSYFERKGVSHFFLKFSNVFRFAVLQTPSMAFISSTSMKSWVPGPQSII